MRNFGQGPISTGIAAILAPIAQAGATIGIEAQRAEINKARLKMGKEICTGQPGQPYDCPALFAPQMPAMPADESMPQESLSIQSSQGISPVVILGAVAALGLAAFLFLGGKKKA